MVLLSIWRQILLNFEDKESPKLYTVQTHQDMLRGNKMKQTNKQKILLWATKLMKSTLLCTCVTPHSHVHYIAFLPDILHDLDKEDMQW